MEGRDVLLCTYTYTALQSTWTYCGLIVDLDALGAARGAALSLETNEQLDGGLFVWRSHIHLLRRRKMARLKCKGRLD